MTDLTAQRTLVKSPPELWSELSEVESLARHLGELGEIRIVKTEPESTVAWEGEQASGTVELEQSGWGTKVTFRATVLKPDPDPEPEPVDTEPPSEPHAESKDGPVAAVEPEPDAESPDGPAAATEPEPHAEPDPVAASKPDPVATTEPETEESEPERQGFFARWLFRRRQPARQPMAIEPDPVAIEPEPAATEPEPVAVDPVPVAVEPEPIAVETEPVESEPVAVAADPIEPAPVVVEPEPTEPEPAVASAADRVQAVLDGTLDALGQAHHRPFSRG